MSKHTAGPWKLGEFNEHLGYDCMTAGVHAGPAVLEGNDYGQKPCTVMTHHAKEKMMADAKLIAAAPDLLDALYDALPYVEDILADKTQLACFKSGVVQKHASAIRAAITKAIGGNE